VYCALAAECPSGLHGTEERNFSKFHQSVGLTPVGRGAVLVLVWVSVWGCVGGKEAMSFARVSYYLKCSGGGGGALWRPPSCPP
jgi:hypothetical protein